MLGNSVATRSNSPGSRELRMKKACGNRQLPTPNSQLPTSPGLYLYPSQNKTTPNNRLKEVSSNDFFILPIDNGIFSLMQRWNIKGSFPCEPSLGNFFAKLTGRLKIGHIWLWAWTIIMDFFRINWWHGEINRRTEGTFVWWSLIMEGREGVGINHTSLRNFDKSLVQVIKISH